MDWNAYLANINLHYFSFGETIKIYIYILICWCINLANILNRSCNKVKSRLLISWGKSIILIIEVTSLNAIRIIENFRECDNCN